MKRAALSFSAVIACLVLFGCNRSQTTAASENASAPQAATTAANPAAGAPASTPTPTPDTAAATTTAASTAPAAVTNAAPPTPVAPPPPPKPPGPKIYTLAAGTPISVRTISQVNTKTNESGTSFEATLVSPLVAEGHTFAKTGATVVGRVVEANKGGRVKGKAYLTLSLASLSLANGKNVTIQSNSVTQEAKSGTGKNLKRTGIATGAGAAIGAIAGGGRGAAIGAGVGAGAGVATNLATRGPAAEIPPETVLNFSLTKDLVVKEMPKTN